MQRNNYICVTARKSAAFLSLAAGAALLTMCGPAHAADLQSEINSLQAQLNQLKADHAKSAGTSSGWKVKGFGFESADGADSLQLTGRLHYDMGAYLGTNADHLRSGVNARRARIGVQGKFAYDWGYALIYDFGGSHDATPGAGIENAFISYNGLSNNHIAPLDFVLGYQDVPWTLDEATSSNDFMFMEHAASQAIATSFGGADQRAAFDLISHSPRYYAGLFLTGPKAGDTHTSTTTDGVGNYAVLGRLAYQVVSTPNATLHLGVNAGDWYQVEKHQIDLKDTVNSTVDPTALIDTGTISNVKNGTVIGPELAGTYHNFYAQGEYYNYNVNRTGTSNLSFNGGYAQASYSIGGRRHYKPGAGAYSGVIPDHDFSLKTGGMGAFELAARYSYLDLNSNNVYGGKLNGYGVGINWYPNRHMRFMIDYTNANITDQSASLTSHHDQSLAARAQFEF